MIKEGVTSTSSVSTADDKLKSEKTTRVGVTTSESAE